MTAAGTRSLTLSIGGTEFNGQISKGVVTAGAADSDFVTFADANAGGLREYRLEFTAVQDHATGSLWDLVWDSAGETVAYVMRPYGNTTPSVTQPHYTGNVTITEPDGDLIGGEANSSSTAKFLIECSWVCDGKPTKVTA